MTNKKIILINGQGGAGKDTFVELVSKYTKVQNFSSVDIIKKMAQLVGWNGEKDERSRKFLSDLKLLCSEYSNAPLSYMLKITNDFLKSDEEVLFLHIRESKELCSMKIILKGMGVDVATLIVRRENQVKITSNMADGGVENFVYDYAINNNSTLEDLEEKAKAFAEVHIKIGE